MGVLEYILLAVLLVCAVVITVAVLFQKSGDKGLSGTIAGAAETFFAKGKSQTRDKILAKITTVLAFVFAILAVVLYIMLAK